MKDGRRELFGLRLPISIGQRFGTLVITGDAPFVPGGRRYFCRCDCGKARVAVANALKSGRTWNCGCLRSVRHGDARPGRIAPEFKVWTAMKQRCHNPKCVAWHRYGGRGITVCERWQAYENFIADMGRRPTAKHSIDRIDNNGNYEPSNCRWATPDVQVTNRARVIRVELDGADLSLKQACRVRGVDYTTARRWVQYGGWSPLDALTLPLPPGAPRAR